MCDIVAVAGYAAQSILAAIGCIQFVSNVVFASWVLKEQVGRLVEVGQPRRLCGMPPASCCQHLHAHLLACCNSSALHLPYGGQVPVALLL